MSGELNGYIPVVLNHPTPRISLQDVERQAYNRALVDVNAKILFRQNELLYGQQLVAEVEWMTDQQRAARISECTQIIARVGMLVKE